MDNLQAIYGVGPILGDKLQKAGYESCAQVASATAEELNEKIGITMGKARRIIEFAKLMIEPEQICPSKPESIDKRQLASQFVAVLLQNPDVAQQIAQEISSELVEIFGKKLRKKVAAKVLSKKKSRKALMSGLVRGMKKI